MAYRDLSLLERHAVIRECVANGIHRLSDIEAAYNAAQQPANEFAEGGSIHIAPSKRGTFTAAATKHDKSVQAFASQVLAHKENYSPAMVKKANFARNAAHWHGDGGDNLTSSPEAELFLDDYAYRAALENPSITPDMVTSAVSNLNFETQNKEGIGGTYDWMSKTVYLPNISKWSQAAGHEIGGHHLRKELFGKMSAVSSDRAHMLEEALPNFYVPLEEIQKSRPLQERIATNTELRAAIIQNTGLSGEALDDYVNNMSDVDLLSLLYQKGNGYTLGSKIPFMRKEAVLSNGQKANIDDYTDLQSIPEGHTSEDWLGISEEERQQLIKEYQTLFDSNLTEEDRKQAEALRWTLLNIAQNNTDFHKSDNKYLAAFGGHLVHQHGFGDWLNRVFGSQESVQTADTIPQDPLTQGLDYKKLRQRQAYTESKFDNNAKSPAGAVGIFQVTPNVLSDYNKANKTEYKVEDLTDQAINSAVRDWQMQALMQRPWVTAGGANDSIQFAKALSGYNWGSTNTVNALNKAKADGVDIYNGWEWLSYLPKETQDYINFILRGQDNSIMRNDSAYHARIKARPDEVTLLNEMKTGGPLYPFSFGPLPAVRYGEGGKKTEGSVDPATIASRWLPPFATNPQEQNVSPKFQQLVNERVQVGQQLAYQRAERKRIEALAHNTNEMLPIQLASQGKLDEARIAGQNLGLQTMGNVADVATDFMPVIGDAKDVIRIGTDIAKGDYTNAALTAGLMALPGSASAIKRILPRKFSTKLVYKALKNAKDFNDSYQFIRGTKPAYWGSGKNPKYAKTVASSLGIDVDVLPTSTSPMLLNKPLAKQVIKDYEPIFRNRLGLNDNVDIYEYIKQNSKVMSGLEKGLNQDLVGLLLGYGDDALMFESVRKTLGANTPTISGFNALTPTQLQQVAKGIETTYKGIDFPKIQVISEKLKRGDYTAQTTKINGQHIGFKVIPEITPEKRIELDDNGFMNIQPNDGMYFFTGGPLYPFSFSKRGLPTVRY